MNLRHILIISYYFPPAGGSEVQRALHFARRLPEFGWQPVVLAPRVGAYPSTDDSLRNQVPAGTVVHRSRSLEPFGWYARFTGRPRREALKLGSMGAADAGAPERIARWVRANLFLPDARLGWVPWAVASGLDLLARVQCDALLTTGPPHSSHFIGLALERRSGLPWIADFRDPWVDINYYRELPHSRAALALDAAFERLVLRRATAVTTVSPFWRRMLDAKRGERSGIPVALIHNGYDPEDFSEIEADGGTSGDFLLTHAGSLYDSRNPEALWAALRTLRDRGAVPRLKIRLIGRAGAAVKAAIDRHGLTAITTIDGFLPHRRAIQLMSRSQLLLFVIEPFALDRGMITGKLYEYLAAGRPVLGIGPSGGDAAHLLRQTGAGRLFDRGDSSGIADYVRGCYAAWAAGEPCRTHAHQETARYTWRSQTQLLAALLDRLVGAPSPSVADTDDEIRVAR